MEEKRPLYAKRIILSFFIATLIFFGGFVISNWISIYGYRSVLLSQESVRYNLLSLDLEKQLMASSCSLFDVSAFSEELDNMGSTIGILETRLGKRDNRVIEQKKTFSMLQIQHYLLIKEYKERCNANVTILLFFYSNKEGFLDDAEKVGFIVSTFRNQNENVLVYSFDYDLDSRLVSLLKKNYNLTQPNVIIINEDTQIVSPDNIEEITRAV